MREVVHSSSVSTSIAVIKRRNDASFEERTGDARSPEREPHTINIALPDSYASPVGMIRPALAREQRYTGRTSWFLRFKALPSFLQSGATMIANAMLCVLRNELTQLSLKWGLWKSLFMDDTAVSQLNDASNVAAACIQDALLKDIVIGLARLLDPKTHGKSQNASVLHATNDTLCSTLSEFSKKVRDIRNKRLAHNDATASAAHNRIDYGLTDTEVNAAFERISAVLNLKECEERGSQTDYACCEDQGREAANNLVAALRRMEQA